MFNSLFLAFAMYSKIPVPRADWDAKKMKYVMCFFPLIGAVIGAIIYGYAWLCRVIGASDLMRSAGLTLIPLIVTGGIHMDGFLDTTDAISSWQPREKKLEILKDSHVGAFAVMHTGIYLVACLGMWSGVSDRLIPVMGVSFMFSRALSGIAVVTFKNAKREGLLATFSTNAEKVITRVVLVVYVVFTAAAMILLDPIGGALVTAAGLLEFGYYWIRSYKQFGGITGDLAGWFVQLAELFMGFAAAAASFFC